ncbi:MAG: RNA repair transcriptional activator RtcR [Planctomycetota bacterium]
MKRTVVIGLLGTTLDKGQGPKRWENWRPSVALCQYEDLIVHRFDLLYQKRFSRFARVVAEDIRSVSPETEVVSWPIEFDDPWDFEEVYGALHDFARAYPFDDEREDYLLNITTGSHVSQICMFLLTESRHFPARLIQSNPPARRRKLEVGTYRIIDLDLSKYDQLAMRFETEVKSDLSLLKSGIETRNEAFNALIRQVERVAMNSIEPILLTGPTGAGKSQLARRIYDLKVARRQISGDFVEVNCATLHGESMMSALFGHVKGAFTGAVKDRTGLLRAAAGGVLLLDEIGELGLNEQAMLLRAIEEKRFLPVGSDREVGSDFQLIAGTNRNLSREVGNGRFREDLLARINLWTFHLPSLKDRLEDIEPNVDYELNGFERKTGRRATFSKEAFKRFLEFATGAGAEWKANFRDLNGAIHRMSTLAPGGRITVETVEEEMNRLGAAWRCGELIAEDEDALVSLIGAEALDKIDLFDRIQLLGVLRVAKRCVTISEAGRTLFAVSRKKKKSPNDADRLRKFLARFDLHWEQVKEPGFAPD